MSGTIGDAALGLLIRRGDAQSWKLDAAMREQLVARYRVPQPRTALAEAVRAHASAAMDVSDGLVGDLAKLCRVSGVSADIEVARVPLSPAAAQALADEPALVEPILTGGEDYEILCAIRARQGVVRSPMPQRRRVCRSPTSAGSWRAKRRRDFSMGQGSRWPLRGPATAISRPPRRISGLRRAAVASSCASR